MKVYEQVSNQKYVAQDPRRRFSAITTLFENFRFFDACGICKHFKVRNFI
jgi:hypothetical protein